MSKFRIGDIVAVAGRSHRMLVVDVEGSFVTIAWLLLSVSTHQVMEATCHESTMILLQRA